jgi:hypothetical protein
VLAATGVGFLAYNASVQSDLDTRVQQFNDSTLPGHGCDLSSATQPIVDACNATRADVQSRQDAQSLRRTLGWGGVGVGVIAIGTGVVLLLTGDDPKKYDRPQSDDVFAHMKPTLTVAPGGGVLGVSGAF